MRASSSLAEKFGEALGWQHKRYLVSEVKSFVSDDKLKSDVEKFQGSKRGSLRAEPVAGTCRISVRMGVVQAVNVSMLFQAEILHEQGE